LKNNCRKQKTFLRSLISLLLTSTNLRMVLSLPFTNPTVLEGMDAHIESEQELTEYFEPIDEDGVLYILN